jgi:exopolysaccharide biosynthesis predicted pyruvyltransferase EpsI
MPYRSDDPFLSLLRSLSGTRVHFFPKSGNAGDGFIAHATYELFKTQGIEFTTHRQTDSVEGQTVLIGGGGNLVEGRYNDVADLIRRHAKNNKIILLPHTIVGFADVLSETHRNLTVFCREPVSYRMALLNGASTANTHLSHDVTFFLDDDYFSRFSVKESGTLKALRTDGEATGQVQVSEDNVDMSLSWNGDLWTSPDFCSHVTDSMAAFVAPFETVQTDRLHVSILSAFLQKNVFLLPNAYYKNRAIFEHSLQPRFPKVQFVNTSAKLDELIAPASSLLPLALEHSGIGNASAKVDLEIALEAQKQHSNELEAALERETVWREDAQRTLQLKQYQWEERLGDLRARIEQAGEEKAAAMETLKEREKILMLQMAARDAVAAHAQKHLNEILHSTSWRLASPLRVIALLIPLKIRLKFRGIIRPLSR